MGRRFQQLLLLWFTGRKLSEYILAVYEYARRDVILWNILIINPLYVPLLGTGLI